MPTLSQNLVIDRCPHCNIATPNLFKIHQVDTNNFDKSHPRRWCIYYCGACGGLVTAWAPELEREVHEIFPKVFSISEDIPERPRAFLKQARESLHTPAGAVMLAASAVDSMLKDRGYIVGDLYSRINKAANDHLITKEMAKWAHEIRLDANNQRHADQTANLPSSSDARRTLDFAIALAEFLFVLPSRVQRGISPP
jgi:hypothetical protein